MPPGKEPVTKTDLDVIGGELKLLRQLMENELGHQGEDIRDIKDWRDQFIAEGGPWRSMNKRVTGVEHFAEDMKGTMDRMSRLFYGVLTAVLASLVLWIATSWPKLAALLQSGP